MKKIFSVFLVIALLAALSSAFVIVSSAEEPLSAKAYSPADDAQYLYVVFNKPVTLGDDVVISPAYLHQWGPNPTDTCWYADIKSNEVIKISDQVYKFTHTTWKDAGTAHVLFDLTASGWYASQGIPEGNVKVVIFGTVTAVDNTVLPLSDPEDSTDNYAGRFHYDLSGSNYHGAYTLSYEKADAVASIPVPEYKVPSDDPSPDTFDALLMVAIVGLTASGTIIAAKKHR